MASPNFHHPSFDDMWDDWQTIRDCATGPRQVKLQGETYLPMPSGFKKVTEGPLMYEAYKMRAQYPDILKPTVAGMVGVIHRVEAEIEGMEEGKPLFGMWEKATPDGLPLDVFHRRITEELLYTARYSILTDMPSNGGADSLPYLVGYTAEQLINWSPVDKDMFVLDETRKVHAPNDEFAWVDEPRFLVLRLGNPSEQQDQENNAQQSAGRRAARKTYTAQRYIGDVQQGEELMTPQVRGGKGFEEIPFVVAGPRDLSMDVEQPPLLGVALASLAIYRLDADYRHQLFHSGQETFVVIGQQEDPPKYFGSGVIIGLPAGSEAKFVGPSGRTIEAHRVAISDERQNAVAAGVRLFDDKKAAESGEALRLRAAAQTATLTTIAKTSAACLEKALRYAAMFVGQNPDEIVVKPNLQFVDTVMDPQQAVYLMQLWQGGAISKQTLYEDLQRGEIGSQERDFDEEEELIKQEQIDNASHNATLGLNPDGSPMQPASPFGGAPGDAGPNPSLNGSSNLTGANLPNRFIETGEGLTVSRGGKQAA